MVCVGVVGCVCAVLIVVAVVAMRKRARNNKSKKEVLSTSEDSYADMSSAAEMANPACKI